MIIRAEPNWFSAGWRLNCLSTPLTAVSISLSIEPSGNNWLLFINGIKDIDTIQAGSIVGTNEQVWIGAYGGHVINDYSGNIDEVRVSKGIARWTANFTVPDAPYNDFL